MARYSEHRDLGYWSVIVLEYVSYSYHLSRYPSTENLTGPEHHSISIPLLPLPGACGGLTPDLSCFAKRIYIHSGGSSRRESIQFFLNPSCTFVRVLEYFTGRREGRVGGCS